MKTYKLIQNYPSVPKTMEVGDKIHFVKEMGLYSHDSTLDTFEIDEIENNSKFWEAINVADYLILEVTWGGKIWKNAGERIKNFPSGEMVNVFKREGETGILTDSDLGTDYHNSKTGKWKVRVNKIQRLSDDMIITVGDYVTSELDTKEFRINELVVSERFEGQMCSMNNDGISATSISILQESDRRFELSNEGVKLYVGDSYWFIWTSSPYNSQETYIAYKVESLELEQGFDKARNAVWFTTKEFAEKYIEESIIFVSEDGVDMYLDDSFVSVNLKVDDELYDNYTIRATDLSVEVRHKETQRDAKKNRVLWFSCTMEATDYLNNLEALYTTEDGVDLFDEIEYKDIYGVALQAAGKDRLRKGYNKGIGDYATPYTNRIWFSDKDKAIEFMVMNSPCLSINDVINNTSFKFQTVINELKRKAEDKILY